MKRPCDHHRLTQRPFWQVGTGSGAPAGQSGARQRTAPHTRENAAASSWARFVVSTRGQDSDAQQPLASFAGSGAYVVVVQSASVAQSAPPGGVRASPGVGAGLGFSVGFWLGVGAGLGAAWSVWDEQARTARRITTPARMERLWQ